MGILDNDDDYGIEQFSNVPPHGVGSRTRGDMSDIMQGALSECETDLQGLKGALKNVLQSRAKWKNVAIFYIGAFWLYIITDVIQRLWFHAR